MQARVLQGGKLDHNTSGSRLVALTRLFPKTWKPPFNGLRLRHFGYPWNPWRLACCLLRFCGHRYWRRDQECGRWLDSLGCEVCLKFVLGLLAGLAFDSQGLLVRKLGVSNPCLQCLNVAQRLLQCAPGCPVGRTFCVQRGIQLRNASFEWRGRIIVTAAIQYNDRYAAILNKTMAWTRLICALLRRLSGRTL